MKRGKILKRGSIFSWQTLLLAVICIAINFFGTRIATFFGWPLFLDSIGTILSAVLGGYLPGIIVGYLTNGANSISDPISLYYGILSVFIALSAAFLSKKGRLRRVRDIVIAIFVFAFIGGVLGSIMTWALYGLGIGSGVSAPYALALYENTSLGLFWSQMFADVFIDVFDKTVTMIIAVLIMRMLPDAWLAQLPLGYLYRKNERAERIIPLKEQRKISLRAMVTGIIVATAVLLGITSIAISARINEDNVKDRYVEIAHIATGLMQDAIDADSITRYLATGTPDDSYQKTVTLLEDIRLRIKDIEYMYVYSIEKDGCHVVFDLDTPDVPAAQLGDVVEFEPAFADVLPDLLAGEEIAPIISNDSYGWLLTIYQPVKDSTNEVVAYACVDITMEDLIADRYIFVIKILSLLFGVSMLIVSFTVWFIDFRVVRPLNELVYAADKFVYDSEDHRLASAKRLRELHISTGDEIENLYKALYKMTDEFTEYVDEINQKNAEVANKAEVIMRMQDNIIMSFASMVEQRDINTGDHIRRTAAYVKEIGEELLKEKQFSEILDVEYLSDLVRSAPLHDIGKISVPDAILNKPGRLTSEEFEVIKQHTTVGEKILRDVLVGIEEESYLSTAIDMALYHHERWEGTGYPKGIQGEEIPLSARIMAVADVFDALVSRRSYKEALPFEDALSVIVEGADKHFDPTVVHAFIAAQEKIRSHLS